MSAHRDVVTGRWWDRRCIHDASVDCRLEGLHVWLKRLPHPPVKANRRRSHRRRA